MAITPLAWILTSGLMASSTFLVLGGLLFDRLVAVKAGLLVFLVGGSNLVVARFLGFPEYLGVVVVCLGAVTGIGWYYDAFADFDDRFR